MRHVAISTLSLVAPLVLLTACGGDVGVDGEPEANAYDGPLYVSRDAAEHPKAGAAGDVVDCDTWGGGGFNNQDVYGEGATADDPEAALEVARSEWLFGGQPEGLRQAGSEDDRVLYVLDVDGIVKQAVIVRNGPATEGAGGPGWYVESWAHCDYAELPESFTDSIGLQIWTDATGQPVPTTVLEASQGPEHCDWQSMIFLTLDDVTYVRDPLPDLDEFFAEPYEEHAELPSDAADTGYERDGEHLWLSADEQRVYVGTDDDVEAWPRTIQPLGCA